MRVVRLCWQYMWGTLIPVAAIVFPHDRVWAFTLLVLASASFGDWRRYGGR